MEGGKQYLKGCVLSSILVLMEKLLFQCADFVVPSFCHPGLDPGSPKGSLGLKRFRTGVRNDRFENSIYHKVAGLVLACILPAAFLVCTPRSGAAQPTPQSAFPDSVATLKTSETLTTWGNLGGMTVDRLGFLYVANFRDAVWRIAPDGEAVLLTNSLYGASGNAVDSKGNLLQANFFANTISRVSRDGQVETLVDTGLNGPVGIAVGTADTLFVCNCSGNEISRVSPDGRAVETLAAGPPFSCPNGITRDPSGKLYVVNFNTDEVIRLLPDGGFSVVATLPAGGNTLATATAGAGLPGKAEAGNL